MKIPNDMTLFAAAVTVICQRPASTSEIINRLEGIGIEVNKKNLSSFYAKIRRAKANGYIETKYEANGSFEQELVATEKGRKLAGALTPAGRVLLGQKK